MNILTDKKKKKIEIVFFSVISVVKLYIKQLDVVKLYIRHRKKTQIDFFIPVVYCSVVST